MAGREDIPVNETDITKNIKSIEWVKAELVHSLSGLFKSLLSGDMDKIIDNLALLVINCFLLLKRMDMNFGQLELRVYEKTEALLKTGHPLEEGYRDLSSLKAYLELKR